MHGNFVNEDKGEDTDEWALSQEVIVTVRPSKAKSKIIILLTSSGNIKCSPRRNI